MFDKDDQEISQLIDASLEAVLSGQATLEQVLIEHPEHADVLRAELEAAMWLVSNRDQVSPRQGFVASSRKRVIARIKQEASSSGAKRSLFGFMWPQKLAYQWAAAILALVLFFSGTSGLVSAAQGTLPGDGLYAVKQISEQVAYTFTFNDIKRIELSASYTQRRLSEVVALIQKGDYAGLDAALLAFQNQVNQTVVLVQTIGNGQPHEKKVLAVTVEQDLKDHASKLDQLQTKVPEKARPELEKAEETSILGASLVGEEAGKIIDPTETPVPTLTVTPTASETPQATETPVPVVTVAVDSAAGTGDDVPAERITHTLDDELGPGKPPTKTPKPTNENRPVKPDPAGRPDKLPKDPKPKDKDK